MKDKKIIIYELPAIEEDKQEQGEQDDGQEVDFVEISDEEYERIIKNLMQGFGKRRAKLLKKYNKKTD